MLGRLTVLLLCLFALTGCDGDGQHRAFTYRLQNQQTNGQYSTLHAMPDGGLLIVFKRLEQPKHIWNLLRVTDWGTPHPRESKLDVDVGPNKDWYQTRSWEAQGDGYDRSDQFLMDPGGNYLVVRLSPNAYAWSVSPDMYPTPQAVLNIIDLHGFKLLRRVVLVDPLLAGGDMGFSPSGAFVVSGLVELHRATVGGKAIQTNQYAVETLTLPALGPESVCNYTIVEKDYSGLTEKEIDEEYDHRANERQAAEDACASKLVPLGFSSLKDVHQTLSLDGRLGAMPASTGHIPPQPRCDFEDRSGNRKYDLLDCDPGFVFSDKHAFRVFGLEDAKQIMDLKVPGDSLFRAVAPEFSGVLAENRGVTYVILLRDGAELEGYRVP